MQYLTRPAISNCFDSKFIDMIRQKISQIYVTEHIEEVRKHN
jgi:hypothetical protein